MNKLPRLSLILILLSTLQVFAIQTNTPEKTAQALYSAWQSGDRKAAAKFASPAAVKWIFELNRNTKFDFENCQRPGSTWSCFYRDENGGAMNMTLFKVGQTYKVKSIAYLLD